MSPRIPPPPSRRPRGSERQARTVLISVALVVSLLALALIGAANLVMSLRVDAAAQRAIANEAALLSETIGSAPRPGTGDGPHEEGAREEDYYTVDLIALDPPRPGAAKRPEPP